MLMMHTALQLKLPSGKILSTRTFSCLDSERDPSVFFPPATNVHVQQQFKANLQQRRLVMDQ